MKNKEIIWAVDPLYGEIDFHARVWNGFQGVVEKAQSDVIPVYVLSPHELSMNENFSRFDLDRYVPIARKSFEPIAKRIKSPRLREIEVVFEPEAGKNSMIRALTRFTEACGSRLIVTGTHAKKGLQRFFLGSFAESLLLHSNLPTLVINPTNEIETSPKRILFLTDFSKKSWKAFEQVIQTCKTLGSEMTIFHKIPRVAEPIVRAGGLYLGGSYISLDRYAISQMEKKEKEAQKMQETALNEGVRTSYEIDPSSGSIVQAAIAAAENMGAGMLALASQSGSLAASLAGSVTRQVCREAKTPVWVLHP